MSKSVTPTVVHQPENNQLFEAIAEGRKTLFGRKVRTSNLDGRASCNHVSGHIIALGVQRPGLHPAEALVNTGRAHQVLMSY